MICAGYMHVVGMIGEWPGHRTATPARVVSNGARTDDYLGLFGPYMLIGYDYLAPPC